MPTPPLPTKKYAAIVIDPPWQYNSSRALVGNGGRGDDNGRVKLMKQVDVESHYNTMSLEELERLELPAKDNCLLFMWVTNPFLCDGSGPRIVKKWGFTPKSVITWAKTQQGNSQPSMKTGHWFRSASEHVIFAVKGTIKRPNDFPPLPTWFPCERLGHSVKPTKIHEYAELATPEGPWLEMFARDYYPNWDSWGNEVPSLFEELVIREGD